MIRQAAVIQLNNGTHYHGTFLGPLLFQAHYKNFDPVLPEDDLEVRDTEGLYSRDARNETSNTLIQFIYWNFISVVYEKWS